MATTKEAQSLTKEKTPVATPESSEGIVLEADYDEDRPNSLPAERQREFQRTLTGQFVDREKAHTAFIQRLLEQGVIPFVPAGRPGPSPRSVPFQGPPISETLVEERR